MASLIDNAARRAVVTTAVAAALSGVSAIPALADQANPILPERQAAVAMSDQELETVRGSGYYAALYGYYGLQALSYATDWAGYAQFLDMANDQYNSSQWYGYARNEANLASSYFSTAAYYAGIAF